MIFTRSPADVSPDTWLTKAQYSSVQLLAPQNPKQWAMSEMGLVLEDSRRVAKTGYLFSELEPELRPTHNTRDTHDSWRYIWNALMRHPAVKGCIKKWDATMSTVGTQAAYMPGDVFDIQYDDVPTMALQRMQPSNGTDCSDAFITQRAAMLTGCMFRALAKLLYGTNLSSFDQLRQRFAIPLVPTKWSRSLSTGTPDTPKSTAWSKHDVIDRKAVQGHVQLALFHKSDAMFHGKLEDSGRSWEIYSCNNFVWLKAKRVDQKHRTYPWPDKQTQTFVVAPLAQSLSADQSSGPVASLNPVYSTGGAGPPNPTKIDIVTAVNIANGSAQFTSATPERVIAAKKRIEEAIKYAVTHTTKTRGKEYAISIFKSDTPPPPPPVKYIY